MSRQGALKAVAALGGSYPQWQASKETVAIYVELLSDIDDGLLEETVRSLIMTDEWCPTVARIRRTAGQRIGSLPPTPAEAWAEVSERISADGAHLAADPWTHPLVGQIVKDLGWWNICHSTSIDTLRAHFLRLYEDKRVKTEEATLRENGALALVMRKQAALD